MIIFNLLKIFLLIKASYSKTVFTPKYKMNNKYPFFLPYSDKENYYLITSQKSLIVKKDNGDIYEMNHTVKYSDKAIFCADKNTNSYIFDSNILYPIENDKFISESKISQSLCIFSHFGCIALTQIFFIYGIDSNKFAYILKNNNENNYNCNKTKIEMFQKLSCKFMIIENSKNIVCAEIKNNDKIKIYLLGYNNSNFDNNFSNEYDENEYINLALYDTTETTIKILCRQYKSNYKIIFCRFFIITTKNLKKNIENLGKEDMSFISAYDFSEKDCCFSEFNSEYLFCCGIQNYIICYRLNREYNLIKIFNISISGRNSYLSIITYNLCATFFFMNNEEKVYEYKIYLPKCNNYKIYSFYNSLNENRNAKEYEKLINLFVVKANNTYLRFDNAPYDFGYFILNKTHSINNSDKIYIENNEYNFDFFITKRNKLKSNDVIINYTVIVENSEAYSKQCQMIFKIEISSCYISCEKCFKDINNSNNTNHNCLVCKENYYPSPIKNNCYMKNETEINWYFDSNCSSFSLCDEGCKSCSGPSKNECLSCFNNSYLYIGYCQNQCESGYFPELINDNGNYYYNCSECFESCETCLDKEKGNFKDMKCEKCKEDYIRYKNNCYQIVNSTIKSFYDPESNLESSCYQKFNLTIKEDSYECIELPDKGYYISNNITGLLSKYLIPTNIYKNEEDNTIELKTEKESEEEASYSEENYSNHELEKEADNFTEEENAIIEESKEIEDISEKNSKNEKYCRA